jgi:hypothetical protein
MIKNDLMDTTPTVEDIGIVTVRMAVLTEATKEVVATAQSWNSDGSSRSDSGSNGPKARTQNGPKRTFGIEMN